MTISLSNIWVVFRRDLAAYFTSPIGYIFMMVFVTISVGLYMTSFFYFPVADMRPFFDNLPLLLVVFLPAVTMRLWAEERKENTWEMLLTFPMRASELVLGKFLAALAFFALTLFATITLPAMLFSLGRPDPGAIFGGYFGTFLLGAFFLSLGIFFSGFFKDQIVAFVVTLLACFFIFLVGTEFIASYIDDRVPGLGSLLSDLLGLLGHYSAFTKGVLDFADICYFVAWTVLFLILNILYIDARSRPNARAVFSGAVASCLGIGFLFNYVMVGQSFLRLDLTEDKIYTISKASQSILSELTAPVQVKVYITPREEMPTGLKSLQRDITDKLEELRVSSGGKIQYTVVPMYVAKVIADADTAEESESKEQESEEKVLEKRMLKKGVQPFAVRAMREDEVSEKLIYSSIGIGYKDKPEEIIPRVMPQDIDSLEYQIVSTVYKLTREKAPVVALVAPKDEIDPQLRQMLMQMGQVPPASDDPYIYLEEVLRSQKYEVKRVDLTKDSPLPDEYDTLVVVNPRNFNERQRWEIARALYSGKSVVLAVQNYEWNYTPSPQGLRVVRKDEKPEVNPLLEKYGLGVAEEVLMDTNKVPLRIQGGTLMDVLTGGTEVNLPMQILVTSQNMDQEMSITSRLSEIFYLWGSPLKIDDNKLKELGLTARILMRTSPRAWSVPSTTQLTSAHFNPPAESEMKQFPLMAWVEGQFPDAYKGQDRPAWPKPERRPGEPPQPEDDNSPEPAPKEVSPKPAKLVLLGCSEIFRKNFLQAANLDLFLNTVDAVTLSENIAQIRGRKPINRAIDRPSDAQKTFWRVVNYGLANTVIALVGITVSLMRRKAREAYTLAQMQAPVN